MTRTNTMKAVPRIAVALLLTAPMLVPMPVRAQSPTPELVPVASAPCYVRKIWDVSSVEGADAANWELRYSPAPSPTADVEAAELVDSREGRQIARNTRNDLRDFRPVLDGSRWFFRVVAASGTEPIGEWSAPAVYDAAYSPNGMYQASASDLSLTLSWALTDALGACADRVHYEVRKDSPGGSPIRSETVSGASGSRTVDVSASGEGTYYVRLAAFYGSDQPEDAVGRVGDDVPVTVSQPVAAIPRPPGQRPGEAPTSPPPPEYRITSLDPWSSRGGGPIESAVEGKVAFRFTNEGPVPSRHRIDECEAFESPDSVEWRPYESGSMPTVELGPGRRTVCLQIAALGPKGEQLVSEPASRSVDVLRQNTEELQLLRVVLSTDRDRSAEYAFLKEKIEGLPIDRGEPTHVRFAECEALESQPWQTWNPKSPPTTSFSTPGVRELCMQLKSEPSGTTALLSAIRRRQIEIFNPLVTRVVTDEAASGYIQWYASKNGFSVSESVFYGSDTSWCNIVLAIPEEDVSASGLVVHPGGSVYTMCKFTLFSGRSLNPPWTVESVSIPGTDCLRTTLVRRPRAGTRNLHTTVEAKVLGRKCADKYSLGLRTEITLSGPEGVNWRHAFQKK